MKMTKLILLLVVLSGYARDLTFEQALTGLPGQIESNMVRDHEGMIWFHSYGALIRYDGYEVLYYKPGPNSISDAGANSIQVDAVGDIWILTENSGLTKYDKSTDSFVHYRHDPTDENSIIWDQSNAFNSNRLFITPKNELLIGTYGGFDIYDIDNDIFTHFIHDSTTNSISSNKINAVIEGADGTIWVGTADQGLNSYNRESGKWNSYLYNHEDVNSIGSDEIWSLMEDKDGEIWIGSRKSGVTRFNPQTGIYTRYRHIPTDPNSIGEDLTVRIYEDSRGIIWFTHYVSEETGITTYNKSTNKFTRHSGSSEEGTLSSNNITTVYEDPVTQIIWIINSINGVIDKVDPKGIHFNKYSSKSPPNSRILSVSSINLLEDRTGRLWVSCLGEGVSIIDRENDTVFAYPFNQFDKTNTINQMIFGMREDQNGTIWAIEYGGALLKMEYDGKNLTLLKSFIPDLNNPNSPLINEYYSRSLIIDRDDPDMLWFCSSSGVTKFHIPTETFTHYIHNPQSDNTINKGIVWAIDEDTLGNMWFSIYSGGFSILNKETGIFKNYHSDIENPDAMHVDQNSGIHFDSFGNIWVYGYKNGMDKFDYTTGKFTHFNNSTGFPAVGVCDEILEDDDGKLWIGSANAGIIKFDIKSETVEAVYNKSDGLLSNIAWATYKTKDGTLWFSGDQGVTSFHPDDLKKNDYIPPIILTKLTQAGVEMDLPTAPERLQEINLDWQSNFFEFQFAGLNYTNPEKNEYAYMLEGLDNEWYYSGNNPFGRYSGLAGGKYTLRLKASNNDGVWNEEGISILVNVNSPFWKTGWFYTLVTLIIGGILVLFFRYQLKINGIGKRGC